MTVQTTNLIQGVGELYVGAFGATEPAASAIATAPASAAWTDVGATLDGVRLTHTPTYTELAVDQLVDSPGRRLTKREFTVRTSLAEATLDNLNYAMNNLTTETTGSGYTEREATLDPGPEDDPTYVALLFDGFAPGFASGTHYRRRCVVRKCLNTAPSELGAMKESQTKVEVEFTAHYVSAAIPPWKITDANA